MLNASALLRYCSVALLGATMLTAGKAAGADWLYRTHSQLVSQAHLIVTATLVERRLHETDDTGSRASIGVLDLKEVLKGSACASTVSILLAPLRPNGLVSSADVQVVIGQSGLWFLEKTNEECMFSFKRPDQFVPMDQAGLIIKSIKAGNHNSDFP